jgi:hypothetical protein
VRFCRGNMDAYAIYGLGCRVFCRIGDVCVGGVFGRCLWAWEGRQRWRSVRGGRHMFRVARSLWLCSREYLVLRQYVSVK